MDLNRLLEAREAEILDDAVVAMKRAHLGHYETLGPESVRAKLASLYDAVRDTVRTRHLAPIESLGESIAIERHRGGFSLGEVQTAFNVLEEALWHRIAGEIEPPELAESLGLVSTALGAGKDRLARTYVSLATNTTVPAFDVSALFGGGAVS